MVKNGDYSLSYGDVSQSVSVDAGKYYTLMLRPASTTIQEDELLENPSKAKLYLYNLTDQPTALTAPEHNTDIFDAVPAGESAARDINAVTLTLAATIAGETVETWKNVALKRRQGNSIVVFGTPGAYQATLDKNEVDF